MAKPRPIKSTVLAWMHDTGANAAQAQRHFADQNGPTSATIRSWVAREKAALKVESERARIAPKVDDLSPRLQSAILKAVVRRVSWLSKEKSIESVHQHRTATVIGILLDKFPDLLALENNLTKEGTEQSKGADEGLVNDMDHLANALGLTPEEIESTEEELAKALH